MLFNIITPVMQSFWRCPSTMTGDNFEFFLFDAKYARNLSQCLTVDSLKDASLTT